jgi:hypothetical protein
MKKLRNDPMRIFKSLIFAGLFTLLVSNQASAQLVQITPNGYGGVNIRAPFVRIHTAPNGPTHVRAPFVDVNAPPPYYQPQPYYFPQNYNGGYPPVYGAPVYGLPNSASAVVGESRSPGPGSVAPSYPPANFGTPPGNAPIPATQPNNAGTGDWSPNTSSAPQSIKSVLAKPSSDGSETPILRRDLIANANELHLSLTRYPNATVWQDFLKLPEFIRDDANWGEGPTIDPEQWNDLVKTLSRFDTTSGKPKMHLIHNLPEFRRTHESLTSFVRSLQDRVQNATEELPQPSLDMDN